MRVDEVYRFYDEYAKPLYCEIEARNNTIPVELLFEIHAAFDHLKRYYIGEETEDLASHKAHSHIKRGMLDAFKLKLKYFNSDVESLLNSGIDFSLIDNGNFLPNLLADRSMIVQLAKKARLRESQKDLEQAFSPWVEASLKMDEFSEKYLTQGEKFDWAKHQTFRWINKDTWRGIFIGFITGVASSFLVWWLTK